MRSLICTEPGKMVYTETDAAIISPGHSLLRIKRVGICGTDLHAWEGTQPYFSYPRILGHELAAEIAEPGDAVGFEKGEAVTIIPYFHCGSCIACRSGKPNCCVQLNVCGVHSDGGLTEYLSVPAYSLVHGDGLNYEQLALVEPLAIGAHANRRGGVQKNEFVLVMGAGPIGLGTMEFAGLAGARVIAMDTNENRLAFCREILQVAFTLNPLKKDVTKQLQEITHGDMPSVVMDATGNLDAIQAGFSYLAHGGRYVLVGLQKAAISFSHPEFHKREATLMSSRNATREDFAQVMTSIKKGWIDPVNYITHRVSFEAVKNEFPSWLLPGNQVIKAMVAF